MASPKFYLTTPIYYVNARPHIGHAYTTIVADIIARRRRLLGDDTWFLTGTDEHGQKIERSALAAGVPPQQFTDQVSAEFRTLWDRMGLTYNDYIRTTDARHKRGVQKLFALLQERGFIYLSSYTGQYCISEETFVEGPPGTIGPDGRPTETVTEENYFFKLSAFQRPLLDLIESNQLSIQPEARRNEVLSFLRGNVAGASLEGEATENSNAGTPYVPGALKDLSISRSSFTWGIPVPGDEKHVIYVWLDALANYMTAVGYGSDAPEDQAMFAKYWPADLHIIGKEISRFHCVYWPAFLLAADLPLPKSVVAHGWLLFDNSKMSKSKGNIVRTETILDGFGDEVFGKQFPDSPKAERDLFASDVLRYFLLREIPFGQDGSFSFDAMHTRYNADLVNGYGNLVKRTLTMISQNFAGFVPSIDLDEARSLEPLVNLQAAFGPPDAFLAPCLNDLENLRLDRFLQGVQTLISVTDQTLSVMAPWKERESPESTLKNRAFALYSVAEAIRIITALLFPVLPHAAAKVWLQLGLGSIEQAAGRGELKDLQWGGLKPGTELGVFPTIFPRADKGLIQIMTDVEFQNAPKPNQPSFGESPAPKTEDLQAQPPTTETPAAPPAMPAQAQTAGAAPSNPGPADPEDTSPQISIDDFIKIDLRVAQIIVAERIPKADKLLRLEVDLGFEKRQILSGIAEWYTPEDLIGRRIVVIANLAPRKMRGLESHGMLLAASHGEGGKPVLATFGEDIALGSRLK